MNVMEIAGKKSIPLPILSISIILALILGLLFGGYPAYTNEISTVSLIVAMTLSLTSISFRNIITRDSMNFSIYSILANYGLLSGLILLLSFFFDNELRYGFIIMAAVPPAVMVMPLTILLGGRGEYAIISMSAIYLLSIFLTPLIIYSLLGEKIDVTELIKTTILLIVFPLILSRIMRGLKTPENVTKLAISIAFFMLIFGIIGKNRNFLLYNGSVLLIIFIANILRTFVPGQMVHVLGKLLKRPKDEIIPLSLFSSFKNDGLAILICLSLFPQDVAYIAVIPCVIAVIVEMVWASYLELTATRNS